MKYTIDNPKLVFHHNDPGGYNFTGVVKDNFGSVAYYENGKRHRTDGPALICQETRNKEWYIHGEHHREDGPAIEYRNGDKAWWYNGKRYGWNDKFTKESWIKKWKLEIFE